MNNNERKDQLKQALTEQRQALFDLVGSLSEAEWQTAVFPDDEAIDPPWTIADLLRHLADAEQGMTRLMGVIRDGGEGVPADFDLIRWNNSRLAKNRHKSPAEVMTEMGEARTALFAFMDSLDEADWDKQGRHGSGRILSIAQICAIIADHDRRHMVDMNRALNMPK
jgi:hypothetical protein